VGSILTKEGENEEDNEQDKGGGGTTIMMRTTTLRFLDCTCTCKIYSYTGRKHLKF
jgi:hypothetical protein